MVGSHTGRSYNKRAMMAYIDHLNYIVHSTAHRDAVLKFLVTLTMTFVLMVIFWS